MVGLKKYWSNHCREFKLLRVIRPYGSVYIPKPCMVTNPNNSFTHILGAKAQKIFHLRTGE
jgi:hypothetical protein